jgi:hypothetical protein
MRMSLGVIEPVSHLRSDFRYDGEKRNSLLQLTLMIHSLLVKRTTVRPVSMVALTKAKPSKFKYNNEMFKTSLKIAVRSFFYFNFNKATGSEVPAVPNRLQILKIIINY